nr:hypothetical protein [Tanacetum cinerariifolium]
AGFGGGVAEGGHFVGIAVKGVEAADAGASRGFGGRLRNGIHAHLFEVAQALAVAAGNAFEHGLGLRHIGVVEEGALSGDVAEGHHATPLVEGVLLFGHGQHLVQAQGRHIERLLEEFVVEVAVALALADVGAHANGVQQKVDFATEVGLGFRK